MNGVPNRSRGGFIPRRSRQRGQANTLVRPYKSDAHRHEPHLQFDAFAPQGIDFEMCLVPPGTFQMGSSSGRDNKGTAHPQTLTTPFWIAHHPVTNRQWRTAVNRSGGIVTVPEWADWYNDQSKADHPVVGVTWFQCAAFVRWLGEGWRLPTEVEWDFAARGVESWDYPFGNDFQPDIVSYSGNSGGSTAAVGSRPDGRSWIGAEDMSGAVWEWTSSLYKGYPYQSDDGREADTGNRTDVQRVLRGGSWYDLRSSVRAAVRNWDYPYLTGRGFGLRVAFRP